MHNYRKLDETSWDNFGKRLLEDEGWQDIQLEFLKACKEGKRAFSEYLDNHLLNKEDSMIGEETIDFDYPFTERTFYSPPPNIQKIIWDKFRGVSDKDKMSYGFWGYIVIKLLKSGSIEPYYLVSKNGEDGLLLLDKAIKTEDTKIMDDCVRKILRSMANKIPRGGRVLFNDFSLGKSYWYYHWAYYIKEYIDLDMEDTLIILKNIGGHSEFLDRMFSSKNYISQGNTLRELLLSFKDKPVKREELPHILDKIFYMSIWQVITESEKSSKN